MGNGLLPVSGLPKAADTSGASLAAHGMSVRWDKKRPLRAVPRLPRQFRGPWDRDPPRGHDFRHVPLVRQDEESGRADGDIGPYGVANRTAGGAQVPRGCCVTVAARNTSTQAVDFANSNMEVVRTA